MSTEQELHQIEARLAAALAQIDAGLDKARAAPTEDLSAALQEERQASAQLQERVRALKIELAEAQQKAEQAAARAVPEVPDPAPALAEKDAMIETLRADLVTARQEALAEADRAGALAAQIEEAAAAAPAPVSDAPAGDLQVLTDLLDATAELRAANGGADADLINKTLLAEVEALRIARQADLAEMNALLAELDPILKESTHA